MARLVALLAEGLRTLVEIARRRSLAGQGHSESPRAVAPVLLGTRDPVPEQRVAEALRAAPVVDAAPAPAPQRAIRRALSARGRLQRLRERLRHPESIREALILKELFDAPLALRRRRR